MVLENLAVPKPAGRQVLLRNEFASVNMIDTYHRKGVYAVEYPTGLGKEAVGVIEALGPEATRFKKGERVVTCAGPLGAYSTHYVVEEDWLVRIPAVDSAVVASCFLKGLTARYLCKQTFPIKPGDVALVYAAAGGTGQLLTQWVVALGGTVIAVTSTQAKADIAKQLGASMTILSPSEDVAARVREAYPQGVDVAFDSVGKATFDGTLKALKKRGMFVSYGNASGPVPEIEPLILAKHGSLFLTRPVLFDYIDTRERFEEAAADLFDALERKILRVSPPTVLPLDQAAEAHNLLESRKTTGSLILDTQ